MMDVDLRALRAATQEQHESVEAMLPLTGPELDLPRYGQILQTFYGMVQGWDAWAAVHAPSHLASFVAERRRSPLLLRDLDFLGLLPLPDPKDSDGQPVGGLDAVLHTSEKDSPEYEAAFLGAMYVMEGSTLGGQYIARHVEEVLGLTPGQGDAYFQGYGEHTGSRWNVFREMLSAVPDEYTATVIAAANAMFQYVQHRFESGWSAATGVSMRSQFSPAGNDLAA